MKGYHRLRIIAMVICILMVFAAAFPQMWSNAQASTASPQTLASQYNYYFGGFHSHTSYSDDTGTESAPPEEAYTTARDYAGADFMAVTDHAHYLTDQEWANLKNAADAYNVDGEFVALAGYEMTANFGHMNVLNLPDDEMPVTDHNMNTWYAKLKSMPYSIAQFNHPGIDYGDFGGFGSYSTELDSIINLYEMSCGEMPIDHADYAIWVKNPEYFANYIKALDIGWHVGPVNNQDNHYKSWLIWNECRAVVLAENLTRNDIYDAVRNRRVYATEDKNKKIYYSVNGSVMGSILPGTDEQLNFVVDIQDPDSDDIISRVDIIADSGTVVKSVEGINAKDYHWEFTLPAEYKYYFVKVMQSDGKMSVTAPVWTGKASIWLSTGSTGVDSPINVRISDLPEPLPEKSWIGLYEEDVTVADGQSSIWWMYLSDMQIVNGGTSFVFNPSSIPQEQKDRYVGGKRYKFIIAYNDSYNVETSTSYEVKARPVIQLSTNLPSIDEKIVVTVTNTDNRNSATDWIGIYEADVQPSGAPPAIWWEYMPNLGITNGSGEFTLDPSDIFYPDRYKPGYRYKFVLCYNDSYNVEAFAEFSIESVPDTAYIEVQAEVDKKNKKLTVKGSISTGNDKKITLVVMDDCNSPCIIDQGISKENGVFEFVYDLIKFKKGKYKVKVGGEKVKDPVETEFICENDKE